MHRRPMAEISAILLAAILILAAAAPATAATSPPPSKEKRLVLDWLSRPDVLARFGKISDSIWSYAELGLQEFRSSKLLADTLEQAGFTVERGLAGGSHVDDRKAGHATRDELLGE